MSGDENPFEEEENPFEDGAKTFRGHVDESGEMAGEVVDEADGAKRSTARRDRRHGEADVVARSTARRGQRQCEVDGAALSPKGAGCGGRAKPDTSSLPGHEDRLGWRFDIE